MNLSISILSIGLEIGEPSSPGRWFLALAPKLCHRLGSPTWCEKAFGETRACPGLGSCSFEVPVTAKSLQLTSMDENLTADSREQSSI